jgi:hypothetical protein
MSAVMASRLVAFPLTELPSQAGISPIITTVS